MCTKGICRLVSIDTLDQPSINTWLTLDQHSVDSWPHSIDSQSMVGQVLTDSYVLIKN